MLPFFDSLSYLMVIVAHSAAHVDTKLVCVSILSALECGAEPTSFHSSSEFASRAVQASSSLMCILN